MKINKISRKLIKPHAPTPQNLKNYKFSLIDDVSALINFAVVLFYESKPKDCSLQLEESLARILVEFYPLAGRFINNYSSIDCCDEGAELVEAEAPDVELIDLIAKTEIDQLDNLLPDQHFRPHVHGALDFPILSIQITRISRGASVIAISVAHEIFDASSLATFVDAWAAAANPDHDKRVIIRPSFHLPSLLPSVIRNVDPAPAPAPAPASGHKFVSKRLFFNKESLRRLKSRIRQTNGKPLSGARVVTAVLAQAVIRLDRAVHGRSRTCVIFQAVNMRERSIPPQPTHTCGNFWAMATTEPIEAADKLDVDQLVRLLGDSVRGAIARHAEIPSPDMSDIYANEVESCHRAACDPEINFFSISNMSGFGFHKADFGWGKPVSSIVRFGQPVGKYLLLMSDKSGDGIEASLFLNQHEVPYFEQDAEIKPFISYYPSRL